MRPIAIKYAQDEAAFFADYATVRYGPPFLYIHLQICLFIIFCAQAHKKLSELGTKFEPAGGIRL